jgi:hypothetical protein
LAARAEQLGLGLNLLLQWVAGDVAAMQQHLQGQGVADGAQGHSLLQVRCTRLTCTTAAGYLCAAVVSAAR